MVATVSRDTALSTEFSKLRLASSKTTLLTTRIQRWGPSRALRRTRIGSRCPSRFTVAQTVTVLSGIGVEEVELGTPTSLHLSRISPRAEITLNRRADIHIDRVATVIRYAHDRVGAELISRMIQAVPVPVAGIGEANQ